MITNNLDLNIDDIKRNNPYDNELGDNIPNSLKKVMPWLNQKGSVNDFAVDNIPTFGGDIVPENFGESQYDENVPWQQLERQSLNDIRAERQPWYDQAANSLVKFGVITGTTFADNFIGTGVGLLNTLSLPLDYNRDINFFENLGNKFFNNPYSREVTVGLQDWIEESMPVYKSDEYLQNQAEGNWHKNLGGTWLLENIPQMGFTAGTVLSGAVQSGAFARMLKTGAQRDVIGNYAKTLAKTPGTQFTGQAVKDVEKNILKGTLKGMPAELETAVNSLKTSGAITNGTALLTSTLGEARVEAVHAAKEFEENQLANLDSYDGLRNILQQATEELRQRGIREDDPNYDQLLDTLSTEKYEQAKKAIKSESQEVAAMTGALNIPILTASNAVTFGRVFSRGFSTQKSFLSEIKALSKKAILDEQEYIPGVNRIIKEGGKYALNSSKAKLAKNLIKPIISEGLWEEMMQGAMSKGAQLYSGSQLNSFLGFKLDPEATEDINSRLDGILKGVEQTYTDWTNYEEGFVGGLFGGIGSVSVRKGNKGFRPSWEGGFKEAIQDYNEENKALNDVVNSLNSRLEDPNFKNYYLGLIRHNSLQDQKDKALEINDEFSFKNADHAQFISDIIMFEKANRLSDLTDVIDEVINSTNITSEDEINKKGDEIREMSRDKSTGADMYKNKTNKEIVEESNKFAQDLKSKVNSYKDISSNLQSLYGDVFTGNSLEELTYYFSQIENWEDRFKSVHQELKDVLIPYLNVLNTINTNNNVKIDINDVLNSDPVEILTMLTNEDIVKDLNESYKQSLKDLAIGDIEYQIQNKRIEDKADKRGMNKMLQKLDRLSDIVKKNKELTTKFPDIVNKSEDLARIAKARKSFIERYSQFINDPQSLNSLLKEQVTNALEAEKDLKNLKLSDKLKQAKTLDEFRRIYNEDNYQYKDKVLDKMSIKDNEEYHELANEFKKSNDFQEWYLKDSKELQAAEMNVIPDVIKAVNDTINNIINNANSFDDIINPYNITDEQINDNIKANGDEFSEIEKNQIKDIITDIINEYRTNNNLGLALNKKYTPSVSQEKGQDVEEDNTTGNIDNEKDLKQISRDITTTNEKIIDNTIKSIDESVVWDNGTHEINIEGYKDTRLLTTNDNPTYIDAVRFLENKGAFQYINEGNLKVGDEVFFVADPEYINLNDWTRENKPLLLATKNSKGEIQIIGTYTRRNFALHQSVIEEYDKLDGNTIYETSNTLVSKVTNVLGGRVGISNEVDLSTMIDGKSLQSPYSDKRIVFGIANNIGSIETNTGDKFLNPTNNNLENAGRVYIGVKNAKGEFIPMALRVKRFGDVDISETEFGKQFDKNIDLLIEAGMRNNDTSFTNQMKQIRNFIYVGSKSNYKLHLRSFTNGNITDNMLVFEYTELDTKEPKNITIHLSTITSNLVDGEVVNDVVASPIDTIKSELLDAFTQAKVPFQINKKSINSKWNVDNTKNYNNILIEANLLTTNLQQPYIRGAYFYYKAFDNDLKLKEVQPVVTTPQVQNPIVNTNTKTTSDNIQLNNDNYIIDDEGNIFLDGKLVTDPQLIKRIQNINKINTLPAYILKELEVKYEGKTYYRAGKDSDNFIDTQGNVVDPVLSKSIINNINNAYNPEFNRQIANQFSSRNNKELSSNRPKPVTKVSNNVQEALNTIAALDEKERNNRTFNYRNQKFILLPNNKVFNITANIIIDAGTAAYNYVLTEYNNFISQNNSPEVAAATPVPQRRSRLQSKMFDTRDSDAVEGKTTLDPETQRKAIQEAKEQQKRDCPETYSASDYVGKKTGESQGKL